MLVEAVERGEKALAGHAEDGVDALGDQRLDEGVPGGAGGRGEVMAAWQSGEERRGYGRAFGAAR